MTHIKLDDLKPLPNNPRQITPEAVEKLKASIQKDGKFMEARPIVVSSDGVILGGNQRHRACLELGMSEVPASWVKRVDWTEDEARRFSVVDNAPAGMAGAWDLEMLANQWELSELEELGFSVEDLGIAIDRDGDEHSGASPWDRMSGDAQSGVMFACGDIHCRISQEAFDVFSRDCPPDNIAQWVEGMIYASCGDS